MSGHQRPGSSLIIFVHDGAPEVGWPAEVGSYPVEMWSVHYLEF
jgi:hypothetical protein